MWKNVQSTVRAIAQEALETAAELRNHDMNDANHSNQPASVEEEEEPNQNQRSSTSLPSSSTRTTESISPRKDPAKLPSTKNFSTSSDVAARLAALKAKLNTSKLNQEKPQDVPPASTQLPSSAPPTETPASTTTTAKNVDRIPNKKHPSHPSSPTAQNSTLPKEIEETQQTNNNNADELLRQLTSLKQQHALELESLTQQVEQAKAAAEQATAALQQQQQQHSDVSSLMNTSHIVEDLRNDARVAAEDALRERSKVSTLENTILDLERRLEKAEHASMAGDITRDIETELLETKAECALLKEQMEKLRLDADTVDNDGSIPAADSNNNNNADRDGDVVRLREELETSKRALANAEANHAAVKQQLGRLKAQMIGDQDEEEEKIRWRVDAEVKLVLEKAGIAYETGDGNTLIIKHQHMATGDGTDTKNAAREKEEEELKEALQRAEATAARWESAVAIKDAELANMQRALGELSYESDAAERLRAELRAVHAEMHALRKDTESAQASKAAAEAALQQAQADAARARSEAAAARAAEAEAQREVLAARVAQQDALRQIQEVTSGGVFDRKRVVSVLGDIAKARRLAHGVQAAALALELSDVEVKEVLHGGNGDGGSGGAVNGGVSLASSWIEFLETQAVSETNNENSNADGVL